VRVVCPNFAAVSELMRCGVEPSRALYTNVPPDDLWKREQAYIVNTQRTDECPHIMRRNPQ
jgi:hypothetical protein